MLTSTYGRSVGFAVAALLLAACSDSAVAPSENEVVGGAVLARNGSVSPNPDKNSSCDTENGTKKRTSADKPDGKNSCDGGGGGGSAITWTVTTSGMDGTDYVNVCYPRNIISGASQTWLSAPQICYPNDPDYKGQITTDGVWTYTFTPPDADTKYFVASPFRNGTTGTPFTGGTLGVSSGVGLPSGSCAVSGPGNWGYCSPDGNNVGAMIYMF